ALSTRYGLLTPYTSFLADERVPLHASELHRRETQLRLGALEQESGQAGVSHRGFKQGDMQAMRAPAPAGNLPGRYDSFALNDGSVSSGMRGGMMGPTVGRQGGGIGPFVAPGAAAEAVAPGQSPARGGMGGMGQMMAGPAAQRGQQRERLSRN